MDKDESSIKSIYLQAAAAPLVEIEGGDDKLYTLVMTNPDSHMTDNEAEVLHWMV